MLMVNNGRGHNITASAHPPRQACAHVCTGGWPFDVSLCLDHHLGVADAVVCCRHCGTYYLIEMLDWQDHERVYRLRRVEPAHAERVIRDLTRGSCDISRAGAEVHHLATSLSGRPDLIMVRSKDALEVVAVWASDAQTPIPGASWRDLPCDGRWIDYARSNVEMLNA